MHSLVLKQFLPVQPLRRLELSLGHHCRLSFHKLPCPVDLIKFMERRTHNQSQEMIAVPPSYAFDRRLKSSSSSSSSPRSPPTLPEVSEDKPPAPSRFTFSPSHCHQHASPGKIMKRKLHKQFMRESFSLCNGEDALFTPSPPNCAKEHKEQW